MPGPLLHSSALIQVQGACHLQLGAWHCSAVLNVRQPLQPQICARLQIVCASVQVTSIAHDQSYILLAQWQAQCVMMKQCRGTGRIVVRTRYVVRCLPLCCGTLQLSSCQGQHRACLDAI